MSNLSNCPVCGDQLSAADIMCEQCGNNEIEDVSFVDIADQQAYQTQLHKKREVWQRLQTWLKPHPEEEARQATKIFNELLKAELRQWRASFAALETWPKVWNKVEAAASEAGCNERATLRRMKTLWGEFEQEFLGEETHQQKQHSALKRWVSGLPSGQWDMVGWYDFLDSLPPPVDEEELKKLRDEELTALQSSSDQACPFGEPA